MNRNEFNPANRDSRRLSESALTWGAVILALGYLWFRLINNLWPEWTTNPQYGYGLLVPFLCIGLLIRRWEKKQKAESGNEKAETLKAEKLKAEDKRGKAESGKQKFISAFRFQRFKFSAFQLFVFALAFLYLPTRLIEASTPEWRPIEWALGIEAIGLTLCVIWLGKGRGWLRQLAFPILFFFVAIPWPTPIEAPIIQGLTRASAAIVIEVLGWLGVPAMAHGNVIEVATGMVGIDEACSGIRSFQSSLMISLFFGEFYRLSAGRRWLLIPMGFVFSMAFNVCRMSLLTLIAAKKGVAAISQYHDPAGITIAILCTLALWGLALLLRSPKSKVQGPKSEEVGLKTTDNETFKNAEILKTETLKAESGNEFQLSAFKNVRGLAISLLIWLVLVEAGVQTWYRSREAHLKPGPTWTLNFPRDNPTLKDLPMDATTRNLLRFDEGEQAAWSEPDGTQWEAFYFNWLPGRVAGYLAKRHTPEACMPAAGWKMRSGPELMVVKVNGIELPMRHYVFERQGDSLQVFQCRWEGGMGKEAYVQHETTRFNLLRGIWAGRGNKGQKVLEIIISGCEDSEQAKAALVRQLEKLITVKSS
jgi:exosortase